MLQADIEQKYYFITNKTLHKGIKSCLPDEQHPERCYKFAENDFLEATNMISPELQRAGIPFAVWDGFIY